jgi:hypothetical protein
MSPKDLHVVPGHYYSPIPSLEDFRFAEKNRGKVNLAGIELNENEQKSFVYEWLEFYPKILHWIQYETDKYNYENTWFFGSDAISLTLMFISRPPRKVVEIGSGHSTALIEDINKKWFNCELSIVTIDPNPERAKNLNLSTETLETKIQQVDYEIFTSLRDNDVLLIDSSHVLKAGSDVHYLFNHVIPHLAKGVKVHIHDIFYPFEYPSNWLDEKIAFNEAYALELLLRNSNKFKILYWNDFLENNHKEWFQINMPEMLFSKHQTGGIWLQVQ